MTNCARAEQFLLNRLAKNIRHCVVTIYLTLHYITLHYITLLTFLHFGAFVRFFPHIQIFSRLYNLPPRQAFWSSRRPDSLAITAFKCMNCLAPEYLSDQFTKCSSISTYKTGNSQLLNIPLFRTAAGQRTFYYRIVLIWNALPQNLKLSQSLAQCRNKLSKTLLMNCY